MIAIVIIAIVIIAIVKIAIVIIGLGHAHAAVPLREEAQPGIV